MRVLVACEYSGTVRDAFTARGHYAMSADLLPSETPGEHYQGDVRDVLDRAWDLMIAHPPCTHLAVSGARWFTEKRADQEQALQFVHSLLTAPVPMIAVENPVSIISSRIRKPDQIIHPWQYGHGETKATALWLKNLPLLTPTNIVEGRENRIHRMPPGPDRWKQRSRTFPGIAAAMAEQWGDERDVPPALERLATLTRRLDTIETVLPIVVKTARVEGASWGAIGTALGTTRQAAQQRYGR